MHRWTDGSVKYLGVKKPAKETLAQYVKRMRREKKKSLQDVEDGSGGEIVKSYISRIENGYVTNPSTKKLKALARGLGVSEDEIFQIARGAETEDREEFMQSALYELYRAREGASPEVQELIDETAKTLKNMANRSKLKSAKK